MPAIPEGALFHVTPTLVQHNVLCPVLGSRVLVDVVVVVAAAAAVANCFFYFGLSDVDQRSAGEANVQGTRED